MTLISPADGVVVPQDDPTIGCPYDPNRGHRFRLTRDWHDADSPFDVQRYDLWVRHHGSALPLVEASTSGSKYSQRACDGFVIDSNLLDWRWQVRAVATDGTAGPWSEVRRFDFAPCRLDDGVRCSAPDSP